MTYTLMIYVTIYINLFFIMKFIYTYIHINLFYIFLYLFIIYYIKLISNNFKIIITNNFKIIITCLCLLCNFNLKFLFFYNEYQLAKILNHPKKLNNFIIIELAVSEFLFFFFFFLWIFWYFFFFFFFFFFFY